MDRFLVHEKASNPKLTTLLALCQFYKITLDYFTCESREVCLAYLKQHRLKNAPPLIQEIALISSQLSPKGRRSAFLVLQWIAVRRGQPLLEEKRKDR
jgi:transcriptional regulator with XRE-family HTH domain